LIWSADGAPIVEQCHYYYYEFKKAKDMQIKNRWLALFSLIFFCTPIKSYSASTKTTLPVSATVLFNGCNILTSKINFGNDMFTFGGGNIGRVDVMCKQATVYSISLDGGVNHLADIRRMKKLSDETFIEYVLYQDPNFLIPWGDGVNYGNNKWGFGSGNTQSHYIYGKVSSVGVLADPGSYSDQVNVTIQY
jgi:spore coat protein U-like protein